MAFLPRYRGNARRGQGNPPPTPPPNPTIPPPMPPVDKLGEAFSGVTPEGLQKFWEIFGGGGGNTNQPQQQPMNFNLAVDWSKLFPTPAPTATPTPPQPVFGPGTFVSHVRKYPNVAGVNPVARFPRRPWQPDNANEAQWMRNVRRTGSYLP